MYDIFMQSIAQDIKNNTYKRIYLLYGPEDYLRLQYRDKLKNALAPGGDSMNYTYHEGKGLDISDVLYTADTMPFMAEYRLIVLENCELNKDAEEKFVEYIPSIPDTTVIVMVQAEVDKRKKLFKAIQKYGKCVEFEVQTADTLKRWIMSKIKGENKKITERTIDIFLDRVGSDMANISTELEKLFSYTQGRDIITEEDVEAVSTVTLNYKVFDLIDRMSLKKTGEAVQMYRELLSMKESPFGVLALIARQFNLMLQISELMNEGLSEKTIESKMGMSGWVLGKYKPKIKLYKRSRMRYIIKRCAETDEAIKKGDMEASAAVELLIIEAGFDNIQ